MFYSKSGLKQHIEYVHETEENQKCGQCEKTFKNKVRLSKHFETHIKTEKVTCTMCDKKVKRVSFAMHMLSHENTAIDCTICHKSLANKAGLEKHNERVHSGATKTFQCSICEKRFLSNSELKLHSTYHSNIRAYECEKCKKSFTSNSNMRHHQTFCPAVTHYKQFSCNLCPKKFKGGNLLKLHLFSHENIEPFKCHFETCSKSFKHKKSLKYHERVHKSEGNIDQSDSPVN